MKAALSLAFLLLGSIALAEEAKDHPCEKIKSACETAGFVKGGHKKDHKGLYKDCMQPLFAGQTVETVTVAAEDVTACKNKKAEHSKYK
jgi:hypothetical protein